MLAAERARTDSEARSLHAASLLDPRAILAKREGARRSGSGFVAVGLRIAHAVLVGANRNVFDNADEFAALADFRDGGRVAIRPVKDRRAHADLRLAHVAAADDVVVQ